MRQRTSPIMAAALAAASLAFVAQACAEVPAEAGLAPPFQVYAGDASKLKAKCQEAPPPVQDLATPSRYVKGDITRSTVDPDADETYSQQVAPLRTYTQNAVRLANRYTVSKGKNLAAGVCTLAWLSAWAKADALMGMQTQTAQFNRSTALASLSLAYLQVAQVKTTDEEHKLIQDWLLNLAQETRAYQDELPDTRNVVRGNHRYWAGLGVGAAAVAGDNAELFAWAMESYRIGVCQVTSDGALPVELGRGPKALSYHAFAVAPLVMLAQLGQRNGLDTQGQCDRALSRLVAFVLQAVDKPQVVADLAGVAQEPLSPSGRYDSNDIAWLEIYRRLDPAGNPWADRMAKLGPMRDSNLGGDLTTLFN